MNAKRVLLKLVLNYDFVLEVSDNATIAMIVVGASLIGFSIYSIIKARKMEMEFMEEADQELIDEALKED